MHRLNPKLMVYASPFALSFPDIYHHIAIHPYEATQPYVCNHNRIICFLPSLPLPLPFLFLSSFFLLRPSPSLHTSRSAAASYLYIYYLQLSCM